MRVHALIGAVAIASITAVGISAVPAAAQNNDNPGQVFSDICGLSGGTASKNWPTTRLTCRFSDGSVIWCTPTLKRCGHTKAATARKAAAKLKFKAVHRQVVAVSN